MSIIKTVLLRFADKRYCDYGADVKYLGQEYKGGRIVKVGTLTNDQIDLELDMQDEREFFINITDNPECEVLWVADGRRRLSFKGKGSNAQVNGNVLSFNIIRRLIDIDLGEKKLWTDEQQQQDYPADKGLQYKRRMPTWRPEWPN